MDDEKKRRKEEKNLVVVVRLSPPSAPASQPCRKHTGAREALRHKVGGGVVCLCVAYGGEDGCAEGGTGRRERGLDIPDCGSAYLWRQGRQEEEAA